MTSVCYKNQLIKAGKSVGFRLVIKNARFSNARASRYNFEEDVEYGGVNNRTPFKIWNSTSLLGRTSYGMNSGLDEASVYTDWPV